MPSNRTDSPTTTRPAWIGYAVTFVVEALLTLVLVLIEPRFPLGQFPIVYVVAIMMAAYLFGEGPAVLALVLGFLSFVYFFVQPRYTFSPPADSPQGWASFVAYLIGAAIVGFATITVRRSKRRIERLLGEVSRSHQRVTDILESITDAFFTLDREWRFVYVNAEAERVLRNPREGLLGRNVWEAYPDAVGSVFDDEYHRAVSQHAAVEFEAFYPPFDAWLEVRAYPSAEGLSVYFHDITERKRAREALRQSEERFRNLFETMAQGVVYQNADGGITSANPAAERILGLTLDQMMGWTSMDPRWRAIHEDGSDFPGETHPAMVALRTAQEVRNIIMGVFNVEQNIYRWININAIPQFKPGEDKPYQVYTTFDDITERKKAEQTLRRYQLLSEYARDIVLFIRPDGTIIEANDSAVKAYGYTHDELLALSIYDLRSPETAPSVAEQMEKANSTGTVFETVHRRKDGSTFPVEVSSQGADIEGERVLLGIIRDITERTRLRRALETQVSQLQRALVPEKPTIGGGYRIAAWYVPGQAGEEIGGDFYDVFETEDGKVGILIGDVSGKGIPAGALAAVTRSTLRAFAYDFSRAGEALTHTNSVLLAQHGEPDTFVTVFLAVLDLESGAIRYANAGHPASMIRHSDTGEIECLESRQPPFVVVEKQDYEEFNCQIRPGDKLLLYTDGVSEAHHGSEMLGVEGVEQILKEYGHVPPEELARRIFEAATERAAGEIADDVAIVIIERPPA